VVVEIDAGNTGIGLALVANARGYRTLIVIPETQSRKRKTCCGCAGPNCRGAGGGILQSETTTSMFAGGWPSS